MIIEPGAKIFASLRRKFSDEYASFFLGTVEAADPASILVKGNLWVWDAYRQNVVKREGERRKLIALATDQFSVDVLEPDMDLEQLSFHTDSNGKVWLAHGETPYLEMAERATTSR